MGRNQTAYAILSKALVDLSNAHHVPDPTAAAALSSLATSCFFTSTEPHDTVEVMRLLESHFSRNSRAAVSTLPADDDETEITPTTDSDDITDDESTSTHRTTTTSRTHSTSSDSEEEEDTDDSAEGTFHARSSHCNNGSRSTCSAVSGWSLLLTSLSLSMIPRIISENSEALLTLLEHPDVDVRIQTGHAFALLFSLLRDSTDESEPFDINDCNDFFDTASFMATVEALCDAQPLPSGLRFSKRDKNKQAPMFRQICRFIQEGIEPTEKMTIKFHPLVFTGWPQVTQLYILRETLTTGFALHMEKNTILHQLFDLRLDPHKSREKLSHVEKRRFKSGNSERAKARTQKRNVDRDVSVAKKHYQDDSHI
ncbi:hypothetical protein Pelo_7266 [Pelomyxa schiedti]|nr:hypothetical protein Pelo_7266 [Pelomyxa schiedti]